MRLSKLALLLGLALAASAETKLYAVIDSNDPAYLAALPGLPSCAPNCAWYARLMAYTSDTGTQAFVVNAMWTDDAGSVHPVSGLVTLHSTAGSFAGAIWVYTGTSRMVTLKVVDWYRVTEIHQEP